MRIIGRIIGAFIGIEEKNNRAWAKTRNNPHRPTTRDTITSKRCSVDIVRFECFDY